MQSLTPSFRWKDYVPAVNAPSPRRYLVTSPDFFRALEKLIQNESLDNWKTYLAYWVIDRNSPYMGQAFQDASFEFWLRAASAAETGFAPVSRAKSIRLVGP